METILLPNPVKMEVYWLQNNGKSTLYFKILLTHTDCIFPIFYNNKI